MTASTSRLLLGLIPLEPNLDLNKDQPSAQFNGRRFKKANPLIGYDIVSFSAGSVLNFQNPGKMVILGLKKHKDPNFKPEWNKTPEYVWVEVTNPNTKSTCSRSLALTILAVIGVAGVVFGALGLTQVMSMSTALAGSLTGVGGALVLAKLLEKTAECCNQESEFVNNDTL